MSVETRLQESKALIRSNSAQITLKLLLIGALIIGLLIPKYLVIDLVQERKAYSQQVNTEVARNWGGSQHLAGPFLVIPYWETVSEKVDNKIVSTVVKRHVLINPQALKVDGVLSTDRKYRSLYEVILYSGKLDISGSFTLPPLAEMEIKPDELLLQEAYLSFLIGDAKGVQKADAIEVNGVSYAFRPSTKGIAVSGVASANSEPGARYSIANAEPGDVQSSGMHALLPVQDMTMPLDFRFSLGLKGSNQFRVAPVAKNTRVHLRSGFPDPVFAGNFATDSGSRVSASGFDAQWTVSEFQRNIPAFLKNAQTVDLQNASFGVDISAQVDNYTKSERAAKYMALIIAFTFLVVFVTEIVNGLRIHIFQYTLIGLAIVIFFTLLLSIGEYLAFDYAYLIAAIAVIGLVSAYAMAIFRHRKSIWTLFGSLSGMFLFMYMIIQMEKYSLITGSIGVFLALAMTMYATRKIQFFESETASND